MYKGISMSRTRSFSEKMAYVTPLAIGTRGTVGSLVMKEIEYFNKVALERNGNSQRMSLNGDTSTSRRSGDFSKPSFWILTLTWKRKKRRSSGNNGILPNIVEASKSNRFNGIPGFGYRILKDDDDDVHHFPI